MCRYYDSGVPKSCTEDDALEVTDKERANFCDYFKPSADAFSPGFLEAENEAKSELAQLFGENAAPGADDAAGQEGDSESDQALDRAEDLFKS